MHSVSHAQVLPRIAILAQAGPLAGDLAAGLSGRFAVERVTSNAEALGALTRGCRALLMAEPAAGSRTESRALIGQALALGCRVLTLGGRPCGLPPEWEGRIQVLSGWPSPQEVVEALKGLDNRHRAEA